MLRKNDNKYFDCRQIKLKSTRRKDETVYKESEAFKQLTFLNERYGSLWSTRLHNWVFNLLHGDDERLRLAKDNFVARYSLCLVFWAL